MKIILISIFLAALALVLLDAFSTLEINSSFAYAVTWFFLLTALLLFAGKYWLRLQTGPLIGLSLFLTLLACTGIKFFSSDKDWKTQTILYRHSHFSFYTIEFQVLDVGARGYAHRVVARTKILPFINVIEQADTSRIKGGPWIKENTQVNELKLKGG